MADTYKKVTEIPTIDVCLVVVKDSNNVMYGLDTADQISVQPELETQDAVKLIIKGVLKAQKGKEVTVTGNTITLRDNVFSPELIKILQGGTLKYWTTAEKTTEGDVDAGFGISSYTPPVSGEKLIVPAFTLMAYSAQYDSSGSIVQYECITYPNCKGEPAAMSAEDGSFRQPEYTIDSYPSNGQAPYAITYVKALPTVTA